MNKFPLIIVCAAITLQGCVDDEVNDTVVDPFAEYKNMVWSDEFESFNTENWSFETGGDGFGNNESQHYTTREKNVRIEDGVLVIEAHKEWYGGNPYTSGKIVSRNKQFFKFGMFEARMKLVRGQGLWPAFWMMPQYSRYGGWPRSGEIDIMEQLGHEPDMVHGTIHFGNAWNEKGHVGTSYTIGDGFFDEDFHLFQLVWEENSIKWYVDGVLYQAITDESVSSSYTYPFNEEFYLILNQAVGGDWPQYPDDDTEFPARFEVDYIRYFTK